MLDYDKKGVFYNTETGNYVLFFNTEYIVVNKDVYKEYIEKLAELKSHAYNTVTQEEMNNDIVMNYMQEQSIFNLFCIDLFKKSNRKKYDALKTGKNIVDNVFLYFNKLSNSKYLIKIQETEVEVNNFKQQIMKH